jgi:hypothetical protein
MIAFLFVSFFSFFGSFFIDFLLQLSNYFSDSEIGGKISDISETIKFGQVSGHVETRDDLYNLSWNTFFEKPLLGSFKYGDAGGHAYFVDKLAYLGILGSLPLFIFFFFQFNMIYKRISEEGKMFFLLSVLLFIILGFTKNIDGIEYWLILFLLNTSYSINLFGSKIN